MQLVKSMKLRRLTQLAHKHQNQLIIYLKILSKVQHTKHIIGSRPVLNNMGLPPTVVPTIWKLNTGPTIGP
jgi:hypothetical protein